MEKSELTPQQVFYFVGYWFDLLSGRVFTHSGKMGSLAAKTTVSQGPEKLHSQTVHVFDGTSYGNRKTSLVRSPPHETHTVAPETTLACARDSGDHSIAHVSPPTSRLVVKREQCALGPVFTSPPTCPSNVYRRLNVGAHTMGDSTASGVWSEPKSHLHINFLELKASLQGPDCVNSN